ncbi:MAG: response regulator transcription factor [Gammaproteobacteria bacterium]|nr:response regulator transcription factor [Gammaproteobacteria bacterium]
MTKKTILIIDDEKKIRSFIRISLTAEGYLYIEAPDAKTGFRAITEEKPNLIILDLGLPDMDGFQFLRKIRQHSKIPVLVLTARDEESEKVKLLEGGANDYLSKPFGIKELIARIKVLLRDIEFQPAPEKLDFKGIEIFTGEPRLLLNQESIPLTKKEHAVLIKLASEPGKLIPHQELLTDIWGPSHIDDSHYLRVLITQLRKKLHDNADAPAFIKTEPGVGYRFIAASTDNDQ